MLYANFKITDHEGTLLDWDELTHVKLHGDNLVQFLADWETTLLNIKPDVVPNDDMLENLFKKQLVQSDQLSQALALYDQDVTQRNEPKSYQKLLGILNNHIDEKRLERNQLCKTAEIAR